MCYIIIRVPLELNMICSVFSAIRDLDIDAVETLIREGANINDHHLQHLNDPDFTYQAYKPEYGDHLDQALQKLSRILPPANLVR